MSNYKKNIDDFFKEKLANYRETPPPDAWDEIETRLDGLKPAPTGIINRWPLHLAIVSVLLILSVSLARKIMSNQTANTAVIAMNENSKTVAQSATTVSGTGNGAVEATDQKTPENGTPADPANATATGTTTNTNPTAATQNENNDNQKGNNNTPATANKKNNSKNTGARKQAAAKQTTTLNAHYTQPGKTANAKRSTSNKYNNNLSKPAPEEEETDNTKNNQVIAASPNTTLSVVNKPEETQAKDAKKNEPVKKTNASVANSKSNTRIKPSFPRFELGVKAGYEGGFNNEAASKFVVSPYLQYNLCPKFSIMTQPGVKYAVTPDKNLGAPQNYYDANPEDMQVKQGTTTSSSQLIGSTTTWTYTTPYNFTQTHDSIVKSNKTGGSAMEYEIPILLKYNLTKKLSVYGGVNLVYNKYAAVTENTYTAKGISRSLDTTVTVVTNSATPPAMSAPQGVGFTYAGSPIGDYQKPMAAHTGYEFSTGYMVGFSYAAGKKLLFDALVEQSPAAPDVKAGYNINTPLSATYFRLSIGYKLSK